MSSFLNSEQDEMEFYEREIVNNHNEITTKKSNDKNLEVNDFFNFENYPIIVVSLSNRLFENDLYFNTYEELLLMVLQDDDNKDLKIIFDFSKCSIIPKFKYVLQHGRFMIKYDNIYGTKIKRSSIIIPHQRWKTYIETLFTFRPPINPSLVALSFDEAFRFINKNS